MPLAKAIDTTAEIGFSAIELACREPHFDRETALGNPKSVAEQIQNAGLKVSALSLFNNFTDRSSLDEQIEEAEMYIRLAPVFQTEIIKVTPGPPASNDATRENWQCLADALERLIPVASKVGIKLAFETHMRQLTDMLASSKHFLEMTPSDVVGLTVDFSNLAFAGEKMSEVVFSLEDRIYHTHIKNGYIDADGGWHFQALDTGLVNYAEVLRLLQDIGYKGYLSIECLSHEAQTQPAETARRDLQILNRYLSETGFDVSL